MESNVAYGECEQNLAFDDVKEAVEIAQAADFVEKMEGTYKAPIAQGGTNVSGGQKQRISIARAIAKKPEILVFDDSFSALDYHTDKILRKTLNEKSKEQTKVIVAQRIGTIRHADQILVLEHGKIAGIGTHEELMKSCKVYKEIAYHSCQRRNLKMPEKRKVNKPGAAPGVSSMVAMDKSNDLQKAYSDFFDYLGRYKLLLGVAIIFSIIGAIFNLIGPGKFSEITNLITEGLSGIIALDKITDIAILLVVLYVLGFVLNYIQGFIMATITQNVTKNMRHDIESKINRLPLKYFDSVPIGDVLSRVTNDVDTIGQMMNQSFSTLVSSAALLLGSLIMMFSTNAMMATSGVLATLLGIFLMFLVIGKSQVHFKGQQEELGIIDGQIEEIYGGHTVVKIYNAVADAREKFHDSNERLFNSAWKAQFLSGIMMPLMIFIGNLAYVVVCIVGAILAAKGSISFGVIVAFMLYIRLFTQPLQNLSQAATSVQVWQLPVSVVFDFLSEEEIGDEVIRKSSFRR